MPSFVRSIAEFLNNPLSDEIVNRAYCGAIYFQGNEEKRDQLQDNGRRAEFAIVALGRGRGWKNYFTPELNERFEKEVLEKLKGTG